MGSCLKTEVKCCSIPIVLAVSVNAPHLSQCLEKPFQYIFLEFYPTLIRLHCRYVTEILLGDRQKEDLPVIVETIKSK